MSSSDGLGSLEGREFPPITYEISREKIREFAAAIGDTAFSDGEMAPPTFAALYGLSAVGALLELDEVRPYLARVIHAEQELSWERPVRASEVLVTTGKVSRVRERASAWFVTVESETSDMNGEKVGASVSTLVIGGAK